jgi:secondary thiamine-phosphate synthase enzyme
MLNITHEVETAAREAGVRDGLCYVFVPHTTAGITINENADEDVKSDIIKELSKIVPYNDGYRHVEGNSDAHIKAVITGSSVTVAVEDNRLVLGTWQGIYFCEFDGPRRRKVYIKFINA